MTNEQIENLPADRETDAMVAVELLGWRWMKLPLIKNLTAIFPPEKFGRVIFNLNESWTPSDSSAERFKDWATSASFEDNGKYDQCGLPHYSTDIKAAWEIVEKIAETHHWEIKSPFYSGYKWFVGMSPHNCTGWNGRPDFQASAETAQLAICRAALLCKFSQESK